MPTPKFHVCAEGWRLYDLWSDACNNKLSGYDIRKLREAYYQHRRECAECSKPMEGVTDAEKPD